MTPTCSSCSRRRSSRRSTHDAPSLAQSTASRGLTGGDARLGLARTLACALTMAELSIDRFVDLYAARTAGMSASEVRALFAVASRPDVVSLAGGMPNVQALPSEDVLAAVSNAMDEYGVTTLQYGGGQGHVALRQRLVALMARHERRVYNLAYRMLGAAEDARDATQDAFLSCYRHLAAFRGVKIFAHSFVKRKNRCGGSNFRSHVTYRRHPGARQRFDAWSKIFYDRPCASSHA